MSAEKQLKVKKLKGNVQLWKPLLWKKLPYFTIPVALTICCIIYIVANDKTQQKIEQLQRQRESLKKEYQLLERSRIQNDAGIETEK